MLLLPLVLLAIAWLQESLDQLVFGGRWALPMVHGGPFWGVLTAPFSHSDWSHLLSNSLWFLPLSYLVLLNGLRAYIAVWIAVYATAALVCCGCRWQAMVSPAWSMASWAICC